MKKRYYANIKIIDIRQVEFETDDDNLSNDELEGLALAVVQREWGSFDEAEVIMVKRQYGDCWPCAV